MIGISTGIPCLIVLRFLWDLGLEAVFMLV